MSTLPCSGAPALRFPRLPVDWVEGDFMAAAFGPVSFDAVLSVATLHHLEFESGLRRCADLVRPGGVVGVVGLAAFDWRDLPYELLGALEDRLLGASREHWVHRRPWCGHLRSPTPR